MGKPKDDNKTSYKTPETNQSSKSKALVDVDDKGNISIQVGEAGNKITQIGQTSNINNFKPYIEKSDDIVIFTPYKITSADFPSAIGTNEDFILALRSQYEINPQLTNWVSTGAKELKNFLFKTKRLTKNHIIISINNKSDLLNGFFLQFSNMNEYRYDDIFNVNESFDDTLRVSKDAKDEDAEYFSNLLKQVDREDRNYSINFSNIDKDKLKLLDGYLSVNKEKLKTINGDNNRVILVYDFREYDTYLHEAVRILKEYNFFVYYACAVASK